MYLDFLTNLNNVWKDFRQKLQGYHEVMITGHQQIVQTPQSKSCDPLTVGPMKILLAQS